MHQERIFVSFTNFFKSKIFKRNLSGVMTSICSLYFLFGMEVFMSNTVSVSLSRVENG